MVGQNIEGFLFNANTRLGWKRTNWCTWVCARTMTCDLILYPACWCKLPITKQHVLLPRMLKSHWVICIINWLVSLGRQGKVLFSFPLSRSPSPLSCLQTCSSVQTHWRAVKATCVPAQPLAPCCTWGEEVRDRAREEYRWRTEHTSWVVDGEQIRARLCSFTPEYDPSASAHPSFSWRCEGDWHRGGTCFVKLLLRHDTCRRNRVRRRSFTEHIFSVMNDGSFSLRQTRC